MATSPNIQPLLDRLDRIIELLKKQYAPKRAPIPDLPNFPDMGPTIPKLNSHCQKCDLELGKVMGHVCSVTNCPTGLGLKMC